MSREISDNDIEKAKELIEEKKQADKNRTIEEGVNRITKCLTDGNFIRAAELSSRFNISIPESYQQKAAEKIVAHTSCLLLDTDAYRLALSYFEEIGNEKNTKLAKSLLERAINRDDSDEFAEGMSRD